jgi:hypothetical protein
MSRGDVRPHARSGGTSMSSRRPALMKNGARADVNIPGFQHENFRRENELVAMGGAHRIRFCGNGCGRG